MVAPKPEKSDPRRLKKLSDLWLFMTRDRLVLASLAIFLAGFVCLVVPVEAAVKGIGGILFGTGLSVGLSTWNNRQQAAKDANLKRKTEVYTPLHAELQIFSELLDQTRRGGRPCPQWINVSGQESAIPFPLNHENLYVQLNHWPMFRSNSRSLDFSEPVRRSLDRMIRLAEEYDQAVEHALKASEMVFASCIKAAITQTSHSEDYQKWSSDNANVSITSHLASSPNGWFIRIRDALATGSEQMPAEESWAAWWLETAPMGYFRPTTLGWLLAKNHDEALRAIYKVLTPEGSYPPPPVDWLKVIVDQAWPTLESSPAYHEVHRLRDELFSQVSQLESRLLDKLYFIQDVYEGGPPPV